jgi:hypothetical protein
MSDKTHLLGNWIKALVSEIAISILSILSLISTLVTFVPSLPHRVRPTALVVALVSFAWANFKVFQKEHTANAALRATLASHAARISQLVIEPDHGSRYILRPTENGDVDGGIFEFRLRIENTGSRNSTVTNYQVRIMELGRVFPDLRPIEGQPMVRGRWGADGI